LGAPTADGRRGMGDHCGDGTGDRGTHGGRGMTAPRLRGRLHQVAFFASVPAGIALVVVADSLVARVAVLVYALSLTAMFGTSAALHRLRWSPPARLRMDRLDRTMIYVLIAGSYTPVCLLALRPGWRAAFLALVWTGVAGSVWCGWSSTSGSAGSRC
jgi:hemolysin III